MGVGSRARQPPIARTDAETLRRQTDADGPDGGSVLFMLFVTLFVGCSCVVIPLIAFGIFAARDHRHRPRRDDGKSRLPFLPTDGVR
jgi:hypothetical protein